MVNAPLGQDGQAQHLSHHGLAEVDLEQASGHGLQVRYLTGAEGGYGTMVGQGHGTIFSPPIANPAALAGIEFSYAESHPMRRLLLVLALAGCNSKATPPVVSPSRATPALTGSPSPAPEATATATPATAAPLSAASSTPAPLGTDEAVRLTAQWTYLGLTNQARADMLLDHLFKAGKNRMLVNWEAYHEGNGLYEVVYSIEPLSRITRPTATPGAAPPRRSPFGRVPRPIRTGPTFTWLYDTVKGTCLPKDDCTKALMELKPSLDAQGLEAVLPGTWRSATSPPVEPPTLTSMPEPPPPPPVDSTIPVEPIQFTGFLGGDKDRKAVLTQGGETFTLGPGGRAGEYRVKSMDADELVIEHGTDSVRLAPGQSWTPGKF